MLKDFIFNYSFESVILLLFFGKGILSILKVLLVSFSSRIVQTLYYHLEKNKLKEHAIFKTLENLKKKERIYDFDSIDCILICQFCISIEIRICILFLKSSLNYFSLTYKNKFISNVSVCEYFNKELKSEREIIYNKILKFLLMLKVENSEAIKNAYKNELENIFQPIYKKFILVSNGNYSFYRSIDLILNQFWIVFLSIDFDIIRVFRKLEKSITYGVKNDLDKNY